MPRLALGIFTYITPRLPRGFPCEHTGLMSQEEGLNEGSASGFQTVGTRCLRPLPYSPKSLAQGTNQLTPWEWGGVT